VPSLEAEIVKLKADLAKAKALNDKMWEGVVGGVLGSGKEAKGSSSSSSKADGGGGGKRRK
jgi:hypothetical protein